MPQVPPHFSYVFTNLGGTVNLPRVYSQYWNKLLASFPAWLALGVSHIRLVPWWLTGWSPVASREMHCMTLLDNDAAFDGADRHPTTLRDGEHGLQLTETFARLGCMMQNVTVRILPTCCWLGSNAEMTDR